MVGLVQHDQMLQRLTDSHLLGELFQCPFRGFGIGIRVLFVIKCKIAHSEKDINMQMQLTIQLTSQGLFIDHPLIREWLEEGLEVIKDNKGVLIRPKVPALTERERVLQILEAEGMKFFNPDWPPSPPLSKSEFIELAQKFSVGRPLSEILIEERTQGW
jgi:hypothetical protein